MKKGIIDVGGGLRGAYATGVFDYCLDMGIEFDLCIGVSAGSANAASFIAGQKRRNYVFYTEYLYRKEYMSMRNFIFKKSYVDLDYIYSTLSNSNGENPLNYKKMLNSSTDLIVVATNAITGEAKYFDKSDLQQDCYDIFKASSAIPFICHPYEVYGTPYYDGALADSIPLRKAFECGCDKVVLILTKLKVVIRTSKTDNKFSNIIQRRYPLAAEKLRLRAQQSARSLPASPSTCSVVILTICKLSESVAKQQILPLAKFPSVQIR